MAAKCEARSQKHGRLMVGRRSLMQLPEIWQRMNVIFLFEIGEAKIKLNLAQLRVDAESPLIYLDRLPITMCFGIQDTEVGKRAHIVRIELQHLIETRFRCRIVPRVQSLARRLKDLLGSICPLTPHGVWEEEQDNQNRGYKKFHEEVSFISLDHAAQDGGSLVTVAILVA